MKTCFVLLSVALLLSVIPVTAQDGNNPYIYYFSPLENAFVLERADGIEHRRFSEVFDVHE